MLYKLRFKLKNFWYENVECRLRPKQKWLTDIVPRTFCDVDSLIEDINFAALVNFWENDNGEVSFRLQYEMYDKPEDISYMRLTEEERLEARAKNKALYDEISQAYSWAKVRKVQDERASEALTSAFRTDRWSDTCDWYHADETRRIEADTQHLTTIIKYRRYLWT